MKLADTKDAVRMPSSDLDMAMMLTDARWGDQYISNELKEKLKRKIFVTVRAGTTVNTSEGEVVLDRDIEVEQDEFLWGQMNYFTRDFRLGNLSGDEVKYCDHFSLLAGDLMHDCKPRAFMVSLARVATTLELSQSKGGFLRKRLGTFTKEEFKSEIGEKPNLLFSGKKKRGGF